MVKDDGEIVTAGLSVEAVKKKLDEVCAATDVSCSVLKDMVKDDGEIVTVGLSVEAGKKRLDKVFAATCSVLKDDGEIVTA